MKSLTNEELKKWWSDGNSGLTVTRDGILRYKRGKEHKFFFTAPETHREISFLAHRLLCFRTEEQFSGGLLWLRRWNIGSHMQTGWLILEAIRRTQGDLRPLELAPAQTFREDEMMQLHAFLIQTIAYGWVADFVPAFGRFFLHFKDNRQICCFAQSPETLKELRAYFQEWRPTDEDPMVRRLASMEKVHRSP